MVTRAGTLHNCSAKEEENMNRMFVFVYGTVSYLASLVTFAYLAGFIGGFAVPKTLDAGATDAWQSGVLIDAGLLALFALQHSVMARPAFKRMLIRFVPAAA